MLINHENVRLCLRKRLLSLDDNGRALPAARAWENENFVPPAKGLWLRESYLPGDELEVSQGMTECVGVYQLDVMNQSGTGIESCERWARLIKDWFPPANSLSTSFDDGTTVEVGIDRSSRSAGQLYNQVWYFIPIRITWRTYGLNTASKGIVV